MNSSVNGHDAGDSWPGPACPAPRDDAETIQLAHGGGGRQMRRLIEQTILPLLGCHDAAAPTPLHDSAVVPCGAERLALTTDAFVVSPLVFPGGDIGKLAVCGTVNDLAMAAARPAWITSALILEEGLPIETVRQATASMQAVAAEAGVTIVAGDTKVVDRGKADGMFITTAGVGIVPAGVDVTPTRVQSGDVVILSGDVARHGTAVMAARDGLDFTGLPPSDCGLLHAAAGALATLGADLHCLRDLTRGGLATALVEIAGDARVQIEIDEEAVAVHPAVAGACELLGLDPLYVANEGRFVALVAEQVAPRAIELLTHSEQAPQPTIIGRAFPCDQPSDCGVGTAGQVIASRAFGARRPLIMLAGEQLPRIC